MKDFVAIFDSGVGGLTVYKTIRETLKNENIVYLADTINCPYGIKTLEEVKNITLNNIKYLKKLGAKAIVIACNTATSSVVKEINDSEGYIIGVVEPTAIYAYNKSKNKKIGLFATNLTVKTKIYDSYLQESLIKSEGCSDFVPMIEANKIDSIEMRETIKKHLENVKDVDTLILGCTHFPFIEEIIKKESNIENIISSGIPTTSVLIDYLNTNKLRTNHANPSRIFLTTGNLDNAKKQIETFGFLFDEVKQVKI